MVSSDVGDFIRFNTIRPRTKPIIDDRHGVSDQA